MSLLAARPREALFIITRYLRAIRARQKAESIATTGGDS